MNKKLKLLCVACALGAWGTAKSQTDLDGIMMAKKNICGGVGFTHSSWNHYWEGTFYRNNANLGTVSSSAFTAMANYGITDQLNVMFTLPYIRTKASAGPMSGTRGIQDLSLMAKYKFGTVQKWGLDFSLIGVAGVSTPVSNYVADYLPLSIGMGSKNAMGRLLLDVSKGDWFINVSGTYIVRSNVEIDRTAYYTTRMVYSNEVIMPDVRSANVRAGYRNGEWVLELFYDAMQTVGGFDMRKNDMPFLSNNMDATRIGSNFKIPVPKTNGLSVSLQTAYTLTGRNVGRTFSYGLGLLYLADFASLKGGKK